MTLQARWESVFARNYGTPRVLFTRGEGMRLWDDKGREYLDFIAGLAVASTGHAHPKVQAAIAKQAGTLIHVSNLYSNEPALALAERLQRMTRCARVFLCNSGTEANEFALKVVARHASHAAGPSAGTSPSTSTGPTGARATAGAGHEAPYRVLAADGSFHGRTAGALTLTGQPKYRRGFPLVPGVEYVPFNSVAALEAAFGQPGAPVRGLFLEAIQGEGGVRPASLDYLKTARRLCDQHGALLVMDEVQTGIGRTGRFLAQEHAGIQADVTTIAKGLASGFPIGGALLHGPAADAVAPGDHGCTFGGGPLAAAAALATLDVIEEEGLVANAEAVGQYLRDGLAKTLGEAAKDVRGWGLLDGVELATPNAASVRDAAERAGLLVNAIGDRILRLAPPLVATTGDVDKALAILRQCV
ncbi:MAG: acetylornithine transaminase [Thermoplasmatota archaeon]